MLKRYSYVISGVSLLLVALYAALAALLPGTLPLFPGWPALFLLVPFGILVLTAGFNSFNCIAFLLGLLILFLEYRWLGDANYWMIFFCLMICIVLVDAGLRGRREEHPFDPPEIDSEEAAKLYATGEDTDRTVKYTAFFSAPRFYNVSEGFDGGKVRAIFGSVEVNLADCEVKMDTTLKCTVLFGRITIIAPRDCRVALDGFNLLGGLSNLAPKSVGMHRPELKIAATPIIGTIEIL